MFAPLPMWFDGMTYDPDRDEKRLSKQISKVWRAMNDGRWHTLYGLSENTGVPEASVSARIRDFRKPRFGDHTVDRRCGERGQWWYRLIPKVT